MGFFSHQIKDEICWQIKGKSWRERKIGFVPKQAKNQIIGKKIFLIKALDFFYNCWPNEIYYIYTISPDLIHMWKLPPQVEKLFPKFQRKSEHCTKRSKPSPFKPSILVSSWRSQESSVSQAKLCPRSLLQASPILYNFLNSNPPITQYK